MMMIPSTGGSSSGLPSTSTFMCRCRSLHILRLIILRRTHFNVDALVVQSPVELVGVILSGVVEVQTQVGVDPDAEVVVHDENLRVVLASGTCGPWGERSTLFNGEIAPFVA